MLWFLLLIPICVTIVAILWHYRGTNRISRYEISTSVRDTDDWRRCRARRGE